MALRISYDMANVDWQAVDEVFRLAPLGRRDPEKFQQACARSAVVVFAYDDDTLIGVGRALSDGAYYAGIYDVAILPAFQGHGVGTRIVLALLEKLPVGTITLFAVPGKEAFYEKLAFRKMTTAMARFADPERQRARGLIE
jgi:GNAT superfamily N-acetyltransferase